jgi:glycosyltransferase involved in cell wall biosynthesis
VETHPDRQALVINLNAPELNHLAGHLAQAGRLAALVRPYVNKDRPWERALARLPLLGRLHATTLGRRRIDDRLLKALTIEAGVWPDWLSAAAARAPWGDTLRHHAAHALRRRVRRAVAAEGARHVRAGQSVVAYEGFALPAFEALKRGGSGRAWLDYPVAHHQERRRWRDEENEREPAFASTWPGFDDWGDGHEDRLDREIALADGVLLGSAFAADSFVAAGVPRSRLHVVPYGVDLALFSAPADPPPRRPFRVVFSGQLTQRKGLSYLLRGYRLFRRDDSELALIGSVVGSREPLRPFASLFTHLPHQPRPALAQRYRASHVLVLPTLVEGMPLVVLEAMACGLPVIVTANGPAGVVRDGVEGFIVPARNDEALADRLQRLYQDEDLRQRMGQAAAERARQFGWSVYGRAVQCLLFPEGA